MTGERYEQKNDIPTRNKKKIKAVTPESTVRELKVVIEEVVISPPRLEALNLKKPSYRNMLMGKSLINGFEESGEFGPIKKNERLITVGSKDSWPSLTTSDKFRGSLKVRWSNCLILKLLGKSIGFRALDERIKRMWMPKVDYELIDVGDGYFLIKFSSLDDLCFALEEGPWIIYGHYLTVRKWFAEFYPSSTSIDSTVVWVRFPKLLVHYYNERMLFAMGNTLGRALKVDPNTSYASKGIFTSVCIEIDFGKALVPNIEIEERWYSIEYEGLPMI
ncbi:hypothetical protein F3Y22_tig00110548pilonHSYRG00029 [Hibiscus syriacus]|uniref:DUF4283 domain-containing protein n=1 Tax=Hibiscus syriacus TaxID=106335 RepID=A0A6A3AAS6_HIBSY|nr:uncharacterized protein LOC120130963 [Hibiscus syriacus]KAE8701043.1 hypothetical protein F3Y22_tig00110548pilonHSYRG00029 [Hibiscus syriacus]